MVAFVIAQVVVLRCRVVVLDVAQMCTLAGEFLVAVKTQPLSLGVYVPASQMVLGGGFAAMTPCPALGWCQWRTRRC